MSNVCEFETKSGVASIDCDKVLSIEAKVSLDAAGLFVSSVYILKIVFEGGIRSDYVFNSKQDSLDAYDEIILSMGQ